MDLLLGLRIFGYRVNIKSNENNSKFMEMKSKHVWLKQNKYNIMILSQNN